MTSSVSVVITTRNRATDLKHCLGSLAGQLELLDELIIIDNNSSDDTAKVVQNYAEMVQFPVRYVFHKEVGYPHVYNRGLTQASGKWVAFIDDDCVADVYWYYRIKVLTGRLPQLAAILGNSREYFDKSTAALSKAYIDEVGKIGVVENNLVVDHEILDSKNIVYNKLFLKKNNIHFDSSLLKYAQGASEDCDLGMQIYVAGGVVLYDEKLIITHKDTTNLIPYYRKIVFTLKNHLVYEKKWQHIRKSISISRPLLKKIKLSVLYKKRYTLSSYKFLLLLVNILITFMFIKFLRQVLSFQVSRLEIKQKR